MNKKQKKSLGYLLIVLLLLASLAYSTILYGIVVTLIKLGIIAVTLGVIYAAMYLIIPDSDSDNNKENKS